MSDERRAAGPRVRVTLPDGQELLAVLLGRRQEADHSWWYTVAVALYDKVEDRGSFSAVPGDVVMSVPAEVCAPVDGEDYSGVRTERALSPTVYAVEQRPAGRGSAVLVVHQLRCGEGAGRRRDVRETTALDLLTRGEAIACPSCQPDP